MYMQLIKDTFLKQVTLSTNRFNVEVNIIDKTFKSVLFNCGRISI